ncbi:MULTISPECIES: hypothetical protein [unclassified Pseudoalteromonas]|uniref:hypothetical protein n=1 Tax=unclassified Pseudoalteromonas TaxID=194690 RepID=UPI000CF609C8|nr:MULTISPECIES: hypothetical protein [unclassified Pseudoalteromonas]
MERVLLFALTLFLSACATKVSHQKIDSDRLESDEQGYLLIGVNTNRSLKSIRISGPQNILLTPKDIRQGSNYILVALPLGTYHIERVDLNRYSYLKLDDEQNWQISLQKSQINYVGHLDIATTGFWRTRSYIELINRSAQALAYLEESFPNLLQQRHIAYGGPGEDGFLEYVQQHNISQEQK